MLLLPMLPICTIVAVYAVLVRWDGHQKIVSRENGKEQGRARSETKPLH
jgi:hypothetical protein